MIIIYTQPNINITSVWKYGYMYHYYHEKDLQLIYNMLYLRFFLHNTYPLLLVADFMKLLLLYIVNPTNIIQMLYFNKFQISLQRYYLKKSSTSDGTNKIQELKWMQNSHEGDFVWKVFKIRICVCVCTCSGHSGQLVRNAWCRTRSAVADTPRGN